MEVKDWPIKDIKPYAGNPRKRSKVAVKKIAASIREFGVRQPIVVDESGEILVGHTRLDAAIFLKMKTFPVHQALGLTEAQKRAYRIADNRTNEETSWDLPLLDKELIALKEIKFDLDLTGIDIKLDPALTAGAAPDTVLANQEEIALIAQRRKEKKKVMEKNDTEKYLVIVFASREQREAALVALNLPTDERYIAAASVTLAAAGDGRNAPLGLGKVAAVNRSGANG